MFKLILVRKQFMDNGQNRQSFLFLSTMQKT